MPNGPTTVIFMQVCRLVGEDLEQICRHGWVFGALICMTHWEKKNLEQLNNVKIQQAGIATHGATHYCYRVMYDRVSCGTLLKHYVMFFVWKQ